MIAMIVLGLLLLFSFVVAYFSARNWYVTHVLLVVGVTLAAVGFLILASATLRTHKSFRSKYTSLQKELASEQTKYDRITGDNPLVRTEEGYLNLPTLKSQFEHAVIDRGRVWRNVHAQPPQAEQKIVIDLRGFNDPGCAQVDAEDGDEFGDEEPGDPQAEPTVAHGVESGLVLHVFEEASLAELGQARAERVAALLPDSDLAELDTKGACRVPAYFLGEFKVTDKSDSTITIQPNLVLDEAQIERIEQVIGRPWVMYEVMPLDSHQVFEGYSDEQLQALRLPNDFLLDGKDADDTAPRQNLRMHIEFLKQTEIDVDLEAEAANDPELAGRYFDASGLAVSSSLRQGDQTVLSERDNTEDYGRYAALDIDTAEKLVADGSAQAVATPLQFRRTLRNYPFLFRRSLSARRELEDLATKVQNDTSAVNAKTEETNVQSKTRESEQAALQEDLRHFQQEVGLLSGLLAELRQQQQEQRQRLSRLYRANNQLARQLQQIQSVEAGDTSL